MSDNTLSTAEIQVLHYMGYRAHTFSGGGFMISLFSAFAHADIFNTMKLASVFPEVAAAIDSYNKGDLMERYGEHVRRLMEKENPSPQPLPDPSRVLREGEEITPCQ